jgi:hypothetical protein
MVKETTLVEYSDGEHTISIKKSVLAQPSSDLARIETLYTISHDLFDTPLIETSNYTQALVVWVGLLAEVVERKTQKPDEYPYSKEQFVSLVSSYVQPDSLMLNETMNNIYKSELKSYK